MKYQGTEKWFSAPVLVSLLSRIETGHPQQQGFQKPDRREMNMHSAEPSTQMRGASLVVKCLTCRSTYKVEDAFVRMSAVTDPDTDEFIQYEVRFTDGVDTEPIWVQDLLCPPKHCSVFGRGSNGDMFAFPKLALAKNSDRWVSFPDSKGEHYAVRRPRA